MAAVGLKALENLAGQLARRAQHEHAGMPPLGTKAARGKMVKDGQREGRRLAGAGLGDADEIAAGEHVWNGFDLDRRRGNIFFFDERLRNRRGEAETVKWSQGMVLSVRQERFGESLTNRQPLFAGWTETSPRDLGCRCKLRKTGGN